MELMKHQKESVKRLQKSSEIFDASDPGTGKTAVEILDFARRRERNGGKALVLAPKSLLTAAWKNDFLKFCPEMYVSTAYAHNRQEALALDADVYVVNHDAVDVIAKMPKKWLAKIDTLIVDESGAFKHHTSGRSKMARKLAKEFEFRRCMNGTPMPNTVLELWHQMYLVDLGKRLGPTFSGFRSAACSPQQVGPRPEHIAWVDRPGIENTVTALLKDVMIRHKFEDCVDIPANHKYPVEYELTAKHMKVYQDMERRSLIEHAGKVVNAVNGGVLYGKLLQIASGAVYSSEDDYTLIDTGRYELIMDLVEARAHSVVFYMWKHQLEQLEAVAKKRKLRYVVWNPDKPEIEQDFQAGKYDVMLAHPQSAGHGLTLTKATATIWASPTHYLDFFLQGFRRIYRIGQKDKTETIVIVGKGTMDERVYYDILANKDARQRDFLTLLESMMKGK